MTTFADSSALVALYVDEPGREPADATSEGLVVSQIARVEVPAALWRIGRVGRVPSSGVASAVGEFVADYAGTASTSARFVVVRLTDAILVDAASLAELRALRAYDAIQLASARAAARADDHVRTFAAYDVHLREAAAVEGFVLVPRTLDDRP